MWPIRTAVRKQDPDVSITQRAGRSPRPLARGRDLRKVTPYVATGFPKVCSGCGGPFVVRNGHAEAIVGPDGRLYCYQTGCETDAFTEGRMALKLAS